MIFKNVGFVLQSDEGFLSSIQKNFITRYD